MVLVTIANLQQTELTQFPPAGATVTKAFASNNTANSLLVYHICFDSGVTISSISDSRNTLVQAVTGTRSFGSFPCTEDIHYVAKCGAGANTLSVTFSGTPAFMRLGLYEFDDGAGNANGFTLDQTAFNDGTAGGAATLTATTPTTTVANELVFGGAQANANSLAAGTGFTTGATFNDQFPAGEEYMTVTSTGTQAISFSLVGGGADWTVIGATFFTASAGDTLNEATRIFMM